MKGKRILITGGAGFIGLHLAKYLKKNNDVIILDKVKCQFSGSIKCDVRDNGWFKKVGRVDYIFHLAAIVGVDYVASHPEETRSTEILGMRNVIDFAKKYKVKKIIYSSTSSVYDVLTHPTSYNTSKLLAEQILRDSSLNYTILRYFNVYGPNQKEKMVVSKFISLASQDKPLIVYMDGNQTRDFTFIEDVVKATVIVSSSNKTNSETFDVCTGVETRISNLAKIIKKGLNSQSKIVYKEFPMGRVNFEVTHRVGCVDKLTQLTRFVPLFDLNKGIRKTIGEKSS